MAKKLTTEEFIEKAKEIHGDKYDYSLVEYKDSRTKVKIICPVHGEFEQLPSNHMKYECYKCGKENAGKTISSNTENFIKKAKEIHGDKYDYSKVNYINNTTKIDIICNVHGIFKQSPSNHLSGYGCLKCGNESMGKTHSISTEEFIKRIKLKYGNKCDKYDYSKVNYIDNSTKILIGCKKHKSFFLQKPVEHMNGSGCTKCGNESMTKLNSLSSEDFIKKAKEVHGDKYDYSKTNYKKYKDKIEIGCSIHGNVKIKPHIHLNGIGCPKCTLMNFIKSKSSNTEEFIKKAIKKHGNKYDYSKVNYINCRTKINIICKKCKDTFLQLPNNHLNGSGCPNCTEQGKKEDKYLYIFYDEKYKLTKIGVSKNPKKRKKSIDKKLKIIKSYKKCGLFESILHKKYSKKQLNHPIYTEGKTEWFNLTKDNIRDIDRYIKLYHINLDHK